MALRAREASDRIREAVRSMDSPRHLVLTAPASPAPLTVQLARLRKALRRLRASRLWKASQVGGAYSVEITRNPKTGRWHPHLHIVTDGTYTPQADLADQWGQALEWAAWDTSPPPGARVIVHISAVHSRASVARYIAKYICKPESIESWPPEAIREYAIAVHGLRSVATFGTLHGQSLAPQIAGEPHSQHPLACSVGQLDYAAHQGNAWATLAVAALKHAQPETVRWWASETPEWAWDIARADPEPARLAALGIRYAWHPCPPRPPTSLD
jgi:hypothetical protein